MTVLSTMTAEEINLLPRQEPPKKIKLITEPNLARAAAEELAQHSVIGFDTETRPSFTAGQGHKVSLLQLSTSETTFLMRLKWTGLPDEMLRLFENPKIIKVGVAVRDDIKALQALHPFEARGFMDLAHEAKKRGLNLFGLRGLTALLLRTRLSKSNKLTNWDRSTLTQSQLEYAATDSHTALGVYQKLMELPVIQR